MWGCELIEGEDEEGNKFLSEIGYTIDNTSKLELSSKLIKV